MTGHLTIRGLAATPVEVPMTYPLGTSAMVIPAAPLLLLDLETEEGVTGRAYLFCYLRALAAPMALALAECLRVVRGDPVAPVDLAARLARHFRLSGRGGIVNMALAGLDMACWDALAVAAGQPLVRLLGAEPKPVRAYNSSGLGLALTPRQLADQAEQLLAGGFTGVKLRVGRPSLDEDLAAIRAVRRRIPAGCALMVDFNQGLSTAEALRRGRAFHDEGIYWIEEPIAHDDYAGAARLARELETPIQIGENFLGLGAMRAALDAGAADYVMPDAERIGGVTGWQRAAALAAAAGVEMSSHLFPEVSAHLLAATPTAHWLEYMDWANPILAEPVKLVDGSVVIPETPGTGIAWNMEAVARFRID